MPKLKLYDVPLSQNGYKVRLALSNLCVEYDFISVDTINGEHKKDWYLKLNPNGQIPTLIDDDFSIWESNAILLYIGRKFAPNDLIPQDIKKLGMMLEWIFFESTKLQQYIQPARFMTFIMPKFMPKAIVDQEKLAATRKKAAESLNLLDNYLFGNEYLALDYSMADIACYCQIYTAPEGGIDTSKYSNIVKWMKRVESQPGYVKLNDVLSK